MSGWYIDRSRNISSIVSSIHYNLLKSIIDSPLCLKKSIDSQELIDELQIDGANKNALLTNFRDLGLINTSDNKPSSFFITCTKANLSLGTIVLLILLKRNDEKKVSNSIKPFVVMAKALSIMKENGVFPTLTWEICDNYLMDVDNYDDIVWFKISHELHYHSECISTPVLDIWFNAMIATGLFDGDKRKVSLKKEYYGFIDFIAKYGVEMAPSLSRAEYVSQACDSKYGWYSLFKEHTYEAVCSIQNLPELIAFVQAEDAIINGTLTSVSYDLYTDNKPKNELEKELGFLRQQELDIQQKINHIEERLMLIEKNQEFINIKTAPANKELYSYYLMENKGLCERTVFSYYLSLEKAKKYLEQYAGVVLNTELYFINDIDAFSKIISVFEGNKKLVEINKKMHNSISAAYNNYLGFLKTMSELG